MQGQNEDMMKAGTRVEQQLRTECGQALNYAKANAEHLKTIERMSQVYNQIVHTTQRLTKTEAAAELAANQAKRDSVKGGVRPRHYNCGC